jgi:thiamine-phosphate pyrophosphorylase
MSAGPRLMMVTDRGRTADLVAQVRAAAAAGVDFVQLREKDLAGGALLQLARAVVDAAKGTSARVLVNSRPDVATLTGAHGVHLPADGLPVDAVRRAFASLLVGVSCHDLGEARAAAAAGATLIVFGPVFPTPGKEERAQGLQALGEVARAVDVPVYAIGGVDPGAADQAIAAGAAGVAAIRPFVQNAGEAVRAFRRRFAARDA